MKDPTAAAQKWSRNLGAATDSIRAGVQAVQTAPGQVAATRRQLWVQNTQAAADKWARNVASVTLSDWQNSMTTKGIDRIAAGATAAEPKMGAFLGRLLPFQENLKRGLPQRGTLEQNLARMNAFVRGMSNFKNTPGGQ